MGPIGPMRELYGRVACGWHPAYSSSCVGLALMVALDVPLPVTTSKLPVASKRAKGQLYLRVV